MKRGLLILLLTLSTIAGAQVVQIQGQVLDPNGNIYQNGSGRATLVSGNGSGSVNWTVNTSNPVQSPIIINALDSFGKFSISVTNTAVIDEQFAAPQWKFCFTANSTIQPQVSFCMTPMALTSSQDISAQIRLQSALLPNQGGGGGGGGGTVTHNSGGLTANDFILGNTGGDIKDSGFAVVPPTSGGTGSNVPPGAGQVLFGSGTGYTPQTISGSCTATAAGVFSCSVGSGLPANICVANSQTGTVPADLAQQTNACDAILGANPGEIWVFGGGVFQTCNATTPVYTVPYVSYCDRAVISSYHTLVFYPGHYTNGVCYGANCGVYDQKEYIPILLSNHSAVEGRGQNWNVIIDEEANSHCAAGGAYGSCGYPNGVWTVIGDLNGHTLNGTSSSDISVTGVHILGQATYWDGGVVGTITLGDCLSCKIKNNWLEHTHTLGIGSGGGSGLGFFAKDMWIEDNLVTDSAAQSFYAINTQDFHFIHNTARATVGQTSIGSNVPFDLEPNAGDQMGPGEFIGNTVDWVGGLFQHAFALQEGNLIYNTPPINYPPILVADNIVNGTAGYPNTNLFINSAFYVAGAKNITVQGNKVFGAGTFMWTDGGGDNLTVDSNQCDECQNTFLIPSLTNSRITNNRFNCSTVSGWFACSGVIAESAGSDYNVFANNIVNGNGNNSNGVPGGNTPVLLGTHSRDLGNYDLYNDFFALGVSSLGVDGTSAKPSVGFQSEWYGGLGLYRAANGKLGVNGSPAITGSLQTSSLATPSQPSIYPQGATGSTSYSYQTVYKDAFGNHTAHSPTITTGSGNATLSSSNFVGIFPADGTDAHHCPPGAASIDIYRTASAGTPSSTGKIGNMLCNDTSAGYNNGYPTYLKLPEFKDTGLAGDSSSPPSSDNGTGSVNASGYQVSGAPLASTNLSDTANLVRTTAGATFGAFTYDFSGSAYVLPPHGTIAGKPVTCPDGSVYFALDATAGQNWFFCHPVNTWTQQLNSGAGGGAFSGGLGTSYQDVTETAAPANPTGSNDRLYLDSTSHTLTCLVAGGGSCMPTQAGIGLNALTAATGANSILNGDNAQVWDWTITTNSKSGFTFGEHVASAATTPILVNINTLSTSTAAPLQVTAGGTTAGIQVNTSGALVAIGAGAITATTAAKWATTRNLAGNSVDGSAAVAFANKFIVQGTTDTGLTNAQFLGALATGIVKNTTSTGVLSIAVAGDFPTLNQNTTGSSGGITGLTKSGSGAYFPTGTNLPGTAGTTICDDGSGGYKDSGCTSALSLQTNSGSNSSQSLLNFETSTANSVGLTVTPSNPSGGIEKFEITGGTYTGTAAALGATPSQCATGAVATGIAANGNANCITLTGGINTQTASYLAVAGDSNKFIRMNCSSCTLTLPASPPSTSWSIAVLNVNASALTVSPNSLNINGGSSSLTMVQNDTIYITTDGSNYFSTIPLAAVAYTGSASSLTTGTLGVALLPPLGIATTSVVIGSGTSIGSTSLCSTVICVTGTYRVNAYVDITTACGTTGTYLVDLIYTDDQGVKTIPVNLSGTGAVPATGILTTTSTSNFGQAAQIVRSTGAASINYSTTAAACGTAGPMVGNLYLSVERVQ